MGEFCLPAGLRGRHERDAAPHEQSLLLPAVRAELHLASSAPLAGQAGHVHLMPRLQWGADVRIDRLHRLAPAPGRGPPLRIAPAATAVLQSPGTLATAAPDLTSLLSIRPTSLSQ